MVSVATPPQAPISARIQIKPYTEQLFAMVQSLYRLTPNSVVDLASLQAKFELSQQECPPALDYKFIFQGMAGAAKQVAQYADNRNPQASYTQVVAIFRAADNFLNELNAHHKLRADLPLYDYYDTLRAAASETVKSIPQDIFKDQFRHFIDTFARPTIRPLDPFAAVQLPQPRFRELEPSLVEHGNREEDELPTYPRYDCGEA